MLAEGCLEVEGLRAWAAEDFVLMVTLSPNNEGWHVVQVWCGVYMQGWLALWLRGSVQVEGWRGSVAAALLSQEPWWTQSMELQWYRTLVQGNICPVSWSVLCCAG